MKIDFTALIKESGEKLSKKALAREMSKEGLFKNTRSAENMIQFHQTGRAKGCDWDLLKFLCERFNRKGSDIIKWDN